MMLFAFSASSTAAENDTFGTCMQQQLLTAEDGTRVGELRAICHQQHPTESQVRRRKRLEHTSGKEPFVITPHKPNYVLPISYNSKLNPEPFASEIKALNNTEVVFQLSFKLKIADDFLGSGGDLYGAYSNQSWWQAYNSNQSAPFRETNHEPEIFLTFEQDWELLGFDIPQWSVGLNHESNGQNGDLSRSWNRVFAEVKAERDNFYVAFKPWWRIPEGKKDDINDVTGDDNPALEHFMGHGELHLMYQFEEDHLGVILRNNLQSDNKGAVQVEWSFPMGTRTKGYVQYFYGYGESLIDHDHLTSRLGFGILLTDWL